MLHYLSNSNIVLPFGYIHKNGDESPDSCVQDFKMKEMCLNLKGIENLASCVLWFAKTVIPPVGSKFCKVSTLTLSKSNQS